MRLLLIYILAFAAAVPALAQPAVVASIRPLQLIAMAITNGLQEPSVVMDSSQDPHHPALRPSQRRSMSEADIFLWVGPGLETGLERVVVEMDAIVIEALALPDMTIYQVGGRDDPHLWLDLDNARRLAETLAQTLAERDAANASRYRANLAAFITALADLDEGIRHEIAGGKFPPFAVYHDGYQYFEKHYGLDHVASFIGNEEVQPGIRELLAIKSALEEADVNCIVVDSSVNTDYLDNLLERQQMHYARVDILAHDVALAADGYLTFMRRLSSQFASCRQ